MSYAEFVGRKLQAVPPTGLDCVPKLPDSLFPHQAALTAWALRRGRAAIFADTGLGKTRMELVWASQVARHTGRPVLILAPLAVAHQTASEAASIGLKAQVCRDGSDIDPKEHTPIVVTNYDRLHLFDTDRFGGVVLDESSVIKHHDAKTFGQLTEAFARTPFRLAATATPAPND